MSDRAYGTSLSLCHVILGSAMLLFDSFDFHSGSTAVVYPSYVFPTVAAGSISFFVCSCCFLKTAPCCASIVAHTSSFVISLRYVVFPRYMKCVTFLHFTPTS